MESLTVLKIGGNVIDKPQVLDAVLRDFAAWNGSKMLVHGGGKIADKLMTRLGIAPNMVDGRRITDRETLDIVTMVYAGLINKNMTAALQRYSCNAIGLTGADADIIPARKRPVKDIDYGYVGDVDPDCIGVGKLSGLTAMGLTPIISPVTHDGQGSLLNTNADTIASSVAVALAKSYRVRLIFCFDKNGVLRDPDDAGSVINFINEALFSQYRAEGIITAGMIPKLDNAFAALHKGVAEIHICSPEGLKNEQIGGTRICID